MIRLVKGLLIGIVLLIGASQSNAITGVLGLASECDTSLSGCTPIPTSAALICDGSAVSLDCPL